MSIETHLKVLISYLKDDIFQMLLIFFDAICNYLERVLKNGSQLLHISLFLYIKVS